MSSSWLRGDPQYAYAHLSLESSPIGPPHFKCYESAYGHCCSLICFVVCFLALSLETTVHLALGKILTIISHFKRTDLLKKNQTGLIEATFLKTLSLQLQSSGLVLFCLGGEGICVGKIP